MDEMLNNLDRGVYDLPLLVIGMIIGVCILAYKINKYGWDYEPFADR